MKTPRILKTAWLFATLSIAGWATAQAQTVYNATWTGPTSGGDWNTAGNWSTGVVPGSDVNGITNATISIGNTVSYNSQMSAASFGVLTNMTGILNVNAAGFNCTNINLSGPTKFNGDLNATTAAAVINVSGNVALTSNSIVTLSGGATLNIQGTLIIGSGIGGTAGSGNSGSLGYVTNNGAFLNAANTSINPANTAETSVFVINGGTNNLGNTSVKRSASTSSYATLGTEGLIIYNGLVIMTNLNVGGSGGNSTLTTLIAGGIVTNFGAGVFINGGTAGRPSRLLQTGGMFVVPDPEVVNPNTTTAGANTAAYSVSGGTNIVGGFYFGASNSAVASTVSFTNAGTIYVGSQGIASNGATIFNNALKAGGLFGATAPWVSSASMALSGSGSFTFQTADPNGNPNNITLNNPLSGSATTLLNVTGGGTLLLNASNTYSGSTLINGGTLELGANGALANSSTIIVGPGTKFDVSAVNGGFVLTNSQILSGSGVVTGAVLFASGTTINPGSNTLDGTLSFSNSVTETGGAINHFDLAGAPNPNNDFVIINGNLNVSGTNYVDIGGASLVPGANYALFYYSGSFNGSLTNFVITSAFGILSNNTTAQIISFIPSASQRGPTNTVWIGNPANTNWDTEVSTSTNWLNAGALDLFVPGDNVQFTDAGASNSPVNIVGNVLPGSILVNSHSNYVFASTSGGEIGSSALGISLTVTNTGTLTILTTNTYTGVTTIDGGSTLAVSTVAVIGSPSAIGESDGLVVNNGTFNYTGPTVSIDRGLTLGNAASAINISANGNLTLQGNIGGTGTLNMVGPGTLINNGSASYAGPTVLSNGTLQVNSTTALGTNSVNFYGGTLEFSGSGGQTFYPNAFNVPTTGTMIFNDANSDNVIGNSGAPYGSLSGTGTLNIDVVSGGYCTINMGIENFAGTIQMTSNSLGILRFNSGGNTTSAQICTGSTNATFNLGTNAVTLENRNGFGTYDLGALAGGSNAKVSGGTVAGTYSIGANNQSTVFAGTIGGAVSITKVGTGTLTLEGASTYTGSTVVSNGVLALSNNPSTGADGAINNTPNIIIEPGAAINVTGLLGDGGMWQIATAVNQTLQGYGTVYGPLDASGTSSTIAPGGGVAGGIGTLTVTGSVFLGGTTWMKINRAVSPNSDKFVSTGFIYYGGTLVVTNIGPSLQVNDTFTLFSGTSYNSSFQTFVLPGVGNGGASYITWDTSQLAVNGSIKVAGLSPLPKVTKANFAGLAGGAITLYSTNGAPNTIVSVLTSTNLALPLSSWTTVTNTYFDSNGNLEDPNTGNPGLTITNLVNGQATRFYLLQTYGNSY
jgi:autotransporter-associated beta strand protein